MEVVRGRCRSKHMLLLTPVIILYHPFPPLSEARFGSLNVLLAVLFTPLFRVFHLQHYQLQPASAIISLISSILFLPSFQLNLRYQ